MWHFHQCGICQKPVKCWRAIPCARGFLVECTQCQLDSTRARLDVQEMKP